MIVTSPVIEVEGAYIAEVAKIVGVQAALLTAGGIEPGQLVQVEIVDGLDEAEAACIANGWEYTL